VPAKSERCHVRPWHLPAVGLRRFQSRRLAALRKPL